MPFYEVEFSYKIEEFGSVSLEANDIEQAEEFAQEHIKEVYADAIDTSVDTIKEIKR